MQIEIYLIQDSEHSQQQQGSMAAMTMVVERPEGQITMKGNNKVQGYNGLYIFNTWLGGDHVVT